MSEKKLTRTNVIGYGLGDMSNGLTFGMSSTYLLAFYTDVLGITAAAAGTLFLVVRLIDAMTDPMMGAFSDYLFKRREARARATGRHVEKFRPFILWGAAPVVLASVLIFMAPENLSTDEKLIWAYATYILWGMAYTFINIPLGSISTVMSQDPVERGVLSVTRGVGGTIGAVIDRVAVPLVLAHFAGDQAQGYFVAMSGLGLIAITGYLICYFTVSENVQAKPSATDPISLAATFRIVLKNPLFVAVSLASLALICGFMISGATTIYYFRENLAALDKMGWSGLTIIGPVLLTAPIIPRLIARYGVKRMVTLSSLIGFVFYVGLLVLPSSLPLYLAGTFAAMIFLTIPLMTLWGMVSDSIDYNQYLSGIRQEGLIYGAYSFVRKTAQALAGFFAGAGLGYAGYVANAPEQTAQALAGIKFLTLGAPAIGLLLAAAVFHWLWILTPEKQIEVAAAIKA